MNISINKTYINNISLEKFIFYLAVVSIFLIPQISIPNLWFKINVTDIILPIVSFIIIRKNNWRFNKYFQLLTIFSIYIFIVIIINNRLQNISDYFEIYKLIKFTLYIIFFSVIINSINTKPLFNSIFFLVIILNILHYFNILDFNKIIEPFYADENHLKFFGLNSLGMPDTKRMLGTMGNPNNNAILFLFFSIYYLPIKNEKLIKYSMFLIAFAGLLMCQSRTALIVILFIFILNVIIQKFSTKEIIYLISMMTLIFAINNFSYLLSILDANTLRESASTRGRLEIWAELWEMIKLKPIFGYGPTKEYFYSNNLYSENEYILFTWRYGFIGLLFYISIIITPIIIYFKKLSLKNIEYLRTTLFTVVMLMTALTNNPLLEPRILIIFALTLSFIFKLDSINIQNEK